MGIETELKQLQKKLWGGAATDWETWDDWFENQNRGLTEWLCTSSGIGPGMKVLDLASGAGQPGLTAAQRVGPTGQVVSTDLAPEMVAAAQRLSAAKGLTNVQHREVDIESIPYPDASFDAVTCRFGLMFCPDPVKGVSEIARVLKPGGRFAVAVWDVPAKNAQFTSFLGALAEIAPPPPPNPKAPGLFRLAAPGEFESVLRAGGFEDFKVEPVPAEWEFTSPENYWEVMTVLAAPLKAAAANLPPETLTRLRESVTEGLRARHGDGVVRLAATPLGASGRK
jgi:SAM-dependent methyltransferase